MTQDEIKERLRKRREQLEKQNQIVTFDTNKETGETTPTLNFDNMTTQQKLYYRSKAIQNGYVNEDYRRAKEQANKADEELLTGASREQLTDFYRVYSDESNRSIKNKDDVSYYKDQILLNRIRNRLGESATPLTYAQDWYSEIGSNVTGAIADVANLGAMGYIAATDNLDADVLYNVALKQNGSLQETLDNYGWGKENYERLERLKAQFPNDEILDTFYNTVTKQNFKGDKSYFDKTVKYINEELSNKARFDTFQRQHTLDETQARENLKLRESMSYDDFARFGLDTVGTISYMLPSIALSAGTGSLASGGVTVATKEGTKQLVKGVSQNAAREIAKQTGLVFMGMGAAGNSATQSLMQDHEWQQSLAKGATDGLLEYISEFVGGEALNKALVGTKTAVTPLGKLIGKGIDKLGIKHKWAKLGIEALGDITAEAWEEMGTEIASQLLDQVILGEEIEDWNQFGIDVMNAGAQSIIPTLVLGGFSRVQVSQKVKSQMEAITLAVEMNEYLTEAQKDKLLDGVVEAYNNAAHLLSDEDTEEQYNKVVQDTFKALEEARPRYESARDLVNVLRARMSQQQVIENEQARNIVDSRLNTPRAIDTIQNTYTGQNVRANLGHALNVGAFGQSTTSQQNVNTQSNTNQQEASFDYGNMYSGKYNGDDVSIQIVGKNPKTGEVVVRTRINGNLIEEPTTMKIEDLRKRINELGLEQTTEALKPNDFKGTEYEWLKENHYFEEQTDKGVERLVRNSSTNDIDNGLIYGKYDDTKPMTVNDLENAPVLLHVMSTLVGPENRTEWGYFVYKNLKDLQKDIRNRYGGIRGIKKDTNGDFEIVSLSGNGKIVYKNGNWITPDGEVVIEIGGIENGEHNRRKSSNDKRGFKQQNNTPSRNDNKDIRKLGKTHDLSKEKQRAFNRQNSNRVYKENYNNIIEKAKKKYGTTKDFKFGAYLLPDGTLLKLERNGRRGGHYLIEELGITQEEFIEAKAIRLVPENGSVQLSKEPTKQQYTQLENFFEYLKENMPNDDYEIWIEIKGRSEPFIFDSKKVGRAITNAIKNYFLENSNKSSFSMPEDKGLLYSSDNIEESEKLFEAILSQLDEKEINEEVIKLWEQETGEDWQMDGWDNVSNELISKAEEIVYNRFVNSEKGKKFIQDFNKKKPASRLESKNKPQKFATDLETKPEGIIERKIKALKNNPNLQEEYESTSIREIREYVKKFLKGRLGTGQFRDRAYGVFYSLPNWIKLRQWSDIDTLAHETGHFIDDEILQNIYKNNKEMKKELEKLCEMAFKKVYNKNKKLKLMEGFAEATRYFLIAPKELAQIAPITTQVIANEFDNSPQLKEFYPKLQKMFHDYINMNSQERLHSRIVNDNKGKEILVDSWLKNFFRTKILEPWFNKNEIAVVYDEKNEKLWKEKYGKNTSLPTTLKLFDNLRRSNSSGESIIQQLKDGVYDPADNKRVTKGLSRILEPLREEAKANHKQANMSYDKYLNKRLNDLMDLGLAERTKELAERSEVEDKKLETGIRLDDALDVIEQFKDDTILHDTLKDIREVGKNIIDYAVKKGVLKEEAASEIKKANMFYMPLNRILDYNNSSFGASVNQGSTSNPIKALRGSDLDIQNPLESLIGNWARVLKTIDDNFVRQQLVKVANQVGDYGDFFTDAVSPLSKYQGTVKLEVFKDFLENNLTPWEFANLDLDEAYNLFVPELSDPKKMTISYLNKGVRKYIKFADNEYGKSLFKILTTLNATQSNQILNAISLFNQGIRYGATTMNPFFAIGNTLSDQFQAFLYSDGLIFPVINAVFDMVRLSKARYYDYTGTGSKSNLELAKLYRLYKESSASLGGKFKLAEKEVKKHTSEIWGVSNKALFGSENKLNQAKDIVSKFGDKLQLFPEFSEEMTRFGEFVRVYDKLIKEGMKPSQAKLEAGIKAREITQDFSIQGEIMQTVNKIIPFSAAKMGGLYRFGQEFKKHPR